MTTVDEEYQAAVTAFNMSVADLATMMSEAEEVWREYGPEMGAMVFAGMVLEQPRWDKQIIAVKLSVAVMVLLEKKGQDNG